MQDEYEQEEEDGIYVYTPNELQVLGTIGSTFADLKKAASVGGSLGCLSVTLAVQQKEAGGGEAVLVHFPPSEEELAALRGACTPATFGRGTDEGDCLTNCPYKYPAVQDNPSVQWHLL